MNKIILKTTDRPRNSKRRKTSHTKSPGIFVSTDSKRQFVPACDAAAHLSFANCRTKVSVEFRRLHEWPGIFRWSVFQQIVGHGSVAFVAHPNAAEHRTLLQAVLLLVDSESDVDKAGTIRQAACEAAALCHPQHIDEAVESIRKRYDAVGRSPPPKSGLTKAIRGLTGAVDKRFGSDAERLAHSFLCMLNGQEDADGEAAIASLAWHRQQWSTFSGGVWKQLADSDLQTRLTRHAQHLSAGDMVISEQLIRNGVTNLRGMCAQFDSTIQMPMRLGKDGKCRPTKTIACQNGLLRLRAEANGEVSPKTMPFTKRHFSTVQLGFTYDPQATCSRWEKALHDILTPINADDRRIEVLQEFFGWTLLPGGARHEAFLVLFGEGANGKSQILAVLREMLGANNWSSLSLEQLGHEFRPAELESKLANISGDMNRVDSFEEGLLKQFVSGEPIQINRKFKDAYTTIPSAKLVFATNHLPQITDHSDGVFRRMIAMPCFNRFTGNHDIKGFAQKELFPELSGIANWAIQGFIRLTNNGRFTNCAVCANALSEHRQISDPFLQFVEERCVRGHRHSVAKSELYSKYRKWCEANGRRATSSGELYRRVAKLTGVTSSRPGTNGERPRIFKGIAIVGSA